MAPGIVGKVKKPGMVSRHPLAIPRIPPPQKKKKCIVNHFYAFNPCVSPLFDCVEINVIFCIRLVVRISIFERFPPTFRGAGDPSPGEPFHAPPRSPSRSSAPILYPVRQRGMLCGTGVEPPRGREVGVGSRRCFLVGYNKKSSKIHLDIITLTTEEYCIIRTIGTRYNARAGPV